MYLFHTNLQVVHTCILLLKLIWALFIQQLLSICVVNKGSIDNLSSKDVAVIFV